MLIVLLPQEAACVHGVVVSGKYPTNLKAHLKAVHALTYDAVVQKEAANKKEKEQVC